MIISCGTEIIETERLILRRFTYDDIPDMLEYWINDPLVQKLYSEPVYSTKEEVYDLLTKYITSYENHDYYRWAIINKENNKCIGQIAYFLVDTKNHFGEIEYCISRKFQRQGLGTESAKAVIKYGFNNINFHKVQICHKEGNLASQGVIKKCGFKFEGTLRDYFYVEDRYVSRLYYSILKNEYK